jgi:hypothetical protein
MKHIVQSNTKNTESYTIVVLDDWNGNIEDHPSIIEHPELFEIVDSELPEKYQLLNYNV